MLQEKKRNDKNQQESSEIQKVTSAKYVLLPGDQGNRSFILLNVQKILQSQRIYLYPLMGITEIKSSLHLLLHRLRKKNATAPCAIQCQHNYRENTDRTIYISLRQLLLHIPSCFSEFIQNVYTMLLLLAKNMKNRST